MGEVVSLAEARLERSQHIAGPYRCVTCKYEWTAMRPLGCSVARECPECGGFTGLPMSLCAPEETYRCHCGCDYYALGRNAAYCVQCGEPSSWPNV